MSDFSNEELKVLASVSELSLTNPFLPERIALERAVLGSEFVWTDDTWHRRVDQTGVPPNLHLMDTKVGSLVDKGRQLLQAGGRFSDSAAVAYEDTVLYHVFNRHQADFQELLLEEGEGKRRRPTFYPIFCEELEHYLGFPDIEFESLKQLPHLFACLYQVRRAFHFIHGNIFGGSMSASRLRGSVWESIFTHDGRRYQRSLYARMDNIPTLITGPSGTGKELVAQAIGYARYIPFDENDRIFEEDYRAHYYPLNLSALAPTLVESELFGHRKGSFTGALEDRAGWFEVCSPHGTVFLDEVGETGGDVQVKLLRILQDRTFQRVGEHETRRFTGKLVAATNRDLAEEMEAGRFRTDLYYRLCADVIHTASLREQMEEGPDHLRHLLLHVVEQTAGPEESKSLVDEIEQWIQRELGPDYGWPGNVRELEQCVRNYVVHRNYRPAAVASPRDPFLADVDEGTLTLEQLLQGYCARVYGKTQNYREVARRLDVDARTVKRYVDAADASVNSG